MLHRFNPKDKKPGIGIPSAHIRDKLDSFRRMLVGMMMGSVGEFMQRLHRAVLAAFPTVNILPVSFILNVSFGNTKFFSISNK